MFCWFVVVVFAVASVDVVLDVVVAVVDVCFSPIESKRGLKNEAAHLEARSFNMKGMNAFQSPRLL